MPQHSDLLEAELHENKGVSTASNNTVATASGGATVWQKIASNNIDATSIFTTNKVYLTVTIADVSTAEVVYLYLPFAGTLNTVGTVLQNTITGADSTVTVRNHSGGSAGTLTIAYSGSAAGDIDTLTPVSNNTFTAGQKISVETNGNSTTASKLFVTLAFTVTG
mgnify:FL=1|jgi:hypothetical protein